MIYRFAFASLLLAACGGPAFNATSALELVDVDAGDADLGSIQLDASYRDAAAELVDELLEHDAAAELAPAPACDLRGCSCGSHVALCCNGPCPRGFEGLSCYCGDCRFPTAYDAGRCF